MEVSGLASGQIPYLSGTSIKTRSSKTLLSGDVHFLGRNEYGACLRTFRAMNSEFYNNGHVEYYKSAPRCVAIKKMKEIKKKKLKLLKALVDLCSPSQISTGLVSEEDLESQEDAEALLQQLEQVRAEEKELKKKKEEVKAKIKEELMTIMEGCACESLGLNLDVYLDLYGMTSAEEY